MLCLDFSVSKIIRRDLKLHSFSCFNLKWASFCQGRCDWSHLKYSLSYTTDLLWFSKIYKKFYKTLTFVSSETAHHSWGVLINKCSKNVPQIYRRTNLQSNVIETTLRNGCSPVNLLHISRTPFPNNRCHCLNWYFPRCSVKKLFLEISKNSQENNCARASF